jgi:methyl-accepting chemotaxis protein
MKLHSRLCVSLTAGMTVTQMDKVTQSNAASAEESAAPAEELTAQAEALKEDLVRLVDGQKAKQGRTATPSAARLAHHAAARPMAPAKAAPHVNAAQVPARATKPAPLLADASEIRH